MISTQTEGHAHMGEDDLWRHIRRCKTQQTWRQPMEEDNAKILEYAHSEFERQNYQQAEDLYTKFITSCLQSR